MIKMIVEKREKFVIFIFNDENSPKELEKCFDEYFQTIEHYAQSSEQVFFKIVALDMDGRWLDLATYWLRYRDSIHFVCSDGEICDTIIFPFGPEATFHKTVEEAISALK